MVEIDWNVEVEKERKKIKEWDMKDRLAVLAKLAFMNASMASSVTGWHTIITSPMTVGKLSEDEMKDLQISFEAITLAFLDLDQKFYQTFKKRKEPDEEEDEEVIEEIKVPNSYAPKGYTV